MVVVLGFGSRRIAQFKAAQPAAVHDVAVFAVGGGEVVEADFAVGAEADEGAQGGVGEVGRRVERDVGREFVARSVVVREFVPEGADAFGAGSVGGGEGRVPEAVLLLVVLAVVPGQPGGLALQAAALEEVVQLGRRVVLPGVQPVGTLVEVVAVQVGKLAAVVPEAARHVGGEAGGLRPVLVQVRVKRVRGVGKDGVAVAVEVGVEVPADGGVVERGLFAARGVAGNVFDEAPIKAGPVTRADAAGDAARIRQFLQEDVAFRQGADDEVVFAENAAGVVVVVGKVGGKEGVVVGAFDEFVHGGVQRSSARPSRMRW